MVCTVSYKPVIKLRSLPFSGMAAVAAVFESLQGKRRVATKLFTYLWRYRPSLTVNLATKLYYLLCNKKDARLARGSIAIIDRLFIN